MSATLLALPRWEALVIKRLATASALVVTAAVAVASVTPAAVAAVAPAPFGHACATQNGVRFCPTTTLAKRVPTWDGVPLDVDVTLPPTGKGPWPLIVMIHGFGGDKTMFEADNARGKVVDGEFSTPTYHYNNIFYAQRGYAVLNYSSRGWGSSCGVPASRTPGSCDRGWWHMADQRYEIRDAQMLIGKLVDGGIAKADSIGATGVSFGGGTSIQLAWLRNRTRLSDGSLIPWRSPKGQRLSLAAAWPRWVWSNMPAALMPNGYFLDTETTAPAEASGPVGVMAQAVATALIEGAEITGFTAPRGADPTVDMLGWSALMLAGEPYASNMRTILKNLSTYSSVTQLSGVPAPLLLESGFTDELFPARESLRAYNLVRAQNPNGQVALQVGDLGHARGSNKLNTNVTFNNQGATYFDYWLRGVGAGVKAGSVTAMTQTCPAPTASPPPTAIPAAGGPFRASSWKALHPGAVWISSSTPRTIDSDRYRDFDVSIGQMFTPYFGTRDACLSTPMPASSYGTAYYGRKVTRRFTLMGLPTVKATIAATGLYPQIASRLWDVAPDGRQTLIARGVRRLTANQHATITFQLSGNAYVFEQGHQVRLELMHSDYRQVPAGLPPTFRPSNGYFRVEISKLILELPVHETPSADGQVVKPVLGA
ncbi:MAG: hypothetical protein NTV40_00505 [Solirubrobacterales bacterium]|nr:hypothetical protein [Solirubrobacterales bacterium]